jgi:hypothetical protein
MLVTDSTRSGGRCKNIHRIVFVASLHIHSITAYRWAERVSTNHLCRPFTASRNRQELHDINYYRWSVGLLVQCQNKAVVVTVKVKIIPNTKRSETEPTECNHHTEWSLWLWRFGALQVHSQRSNSELRTLCDPFMACARNDRKFADFCTTAMLVCSLHRHPAALISVQQTFSCSQSLHLIYEDVTVNQ